MASFGVLCQVFAVLVPLLGYNGEARCEFQAIFNFGDSNSDTGGFWAAFPAQPAPFGMTYFKKPAGRASDGRLIVDFLGKNLQPPPTQNIKLFLTISSSE